MKIFSPLFELVLRWSRHPKAPWYLAGLSFAESSFFPIPPDVMLMPMVVAQPKKAWSLAAITTICSVVGGMAGFAIGGLVEMSGWQPVFGLWAFILLGASLLIWFKRDEETKR
jgi:membrane protein YqaA with SNARE-associated domain